MSFIIKHDGFIKFLGYQNSSYFRVERVVFNNQSGVNDYKINSLKDLIYVANKIDESTGNSFTFHLLHKDKTRESFSVEDALLMKDYINEHLKDMKSMTFAERNKLMFGKKDHRLRVEPTPDLSVPHSGKCGHCRSAVKPDNAHCSQCGAFWGLPGNDARLRDEYITGFYTITSIILVLALVFFLIPVAAKIIVGIFYFFLTPVLFYWFGRCLIGMIAHTPKKQVHQWWKRRA